MEVSVSFLNGLDDLIKKGQGQKVQSQLHLLKPSEVPRVHCAALAKIAMRIGDTHFAFKLLRPLIQSEIPLHPPITVDEQIQYGMCLKQFGASDHALKIFQSVSTQNHPEMFLYEAITLFTQWRYVEAIPKLESYIRATVLGDYQKLIGKVNLASALIFTDRLQEAHSLLSHAIAEAKAEGHDLIRGNALELMTQVFIHQKKLDDAERSVAEAGNLIQNSAPVYRLFLEKWSAVAQLIRSKNSFESLQNLNWVREKAIKMNHWESVRECDFFFSVLKADKHLFNRLYFGTPHEPYRQRLIKHFPEAHVIPAFFEWRGNSAHQPVIGEVKEIDFTADVKNNQILRLLKALSLDFYSPVKPFTLYLKFFPDDKLDPIAALPRIFSNVSRTKKWLQENNIPLEIESSEAGYKLNWTAPFILRIPSGIEVANTNASAFGVLQKHFLNNGFSSAEAAKALGISQRSVVRLLKDAVGEEVLELNGKGRNTLYRFKMLKAA